MSRLKKTTAPKRPLSPRRHPDMILSNTPVQATLAERGTTHGDYALDAGMAQAIKHAMQSSPNWKFLRATQQHTLDMIAVKIGRILAGNANHDDHWRDIAGYAQLICNEIYKNKQRKSNV